MTRSQFISEFILKFYSNQVGVDQILKDAQVAWAVIGEGVVN